MKWKFETPWLSRRDDEWASDPQARTYMSLCNTGVRHLFDLRDNVRRIRVHVVICGGMMFVPIAHAGTKIPSDKDTYNARVITHRNGEGSFILRESQVHLGNNLWQSFDHGDIANWLARRLEGTGYNERPVVCVKFWLEAEVV